MPPELGDKMTPWELFNSIELSKEPAHQRKRMVWILTRIDDYELIWALGFEIARLRVMIDILERGEEQE